MTINAPEILNIVVAALLGLILWLVKKSNNIGKSNSDSIAELKTDIAVIKTVISDVKSDHDKLTVLEYKNSVLKGDINAAHDKIRGINSAH